LSAAGPRYIRSKIERPGNQNISALGTEEQLKINLCNQTFAQVTDQPGLCNKTLMVDLNND
uniref:Uncharacterized protein n=1 Tax=Romanomermis culicivorax TaxID=13658 RepID=A0A915ILG3_ROMCU